MLSYLQTTPITTPTSGRNQSCVHVERTGYHKQLYHGGEWRGLSDPHLDTCCVSSLSLSLSLSLQATFCGSNLAAGEGCHFSIKDLESMGYSFCDTLLDYCDPDQTKVPPSIPPSLPPSLVTLLSVSRCSTFWRPSQRSIDKL